MPRFLRGTRFLKDILSGRFSLCNDRCCATAVCCANKYKPCYAIGLCGQPGPDGPRIWVCNRDGILGTPPYAVIRFNGLCWTADELPPPFQTCVPVDQLPSGTTVLEPGSVEPVPQGCVVGVCPDTDLFLPTEPCQCNEVQPVAPIWMCAAYVTACITGQVTVVDPMRTDDAVSYCVTVRPGVGIPRSAIPNDGSTVVNTISDTQVNNCCGCCASLNQSCNQVGPPDGFQLSCLCGDSPGTFCGEGPRPYCCSTEGTQRTTINFQYSNNAGQSVTGSALRITRYDSNGQVIEDTLSGSWTVIDPVTPPSPRTGSFGFGPSDVRIEHPYIGCVPGKFDRDIAGSVFGMPFLFGFFYNFTDRPDQGCGCIFTINDWRRSYAQVNNCEVVNSLGEFQNTVSGTVLTEWTSTGPCSGGCGNGKTVIIKPGTGTPADPGNTNPTPGGPIPNTGLPEDIF